MVRNFINNVFSKCVPAIRALVFVCAAVFSTSIYAQNFRRDVRSESYKNDVNNVLQADEFSKIDLLNALSFAGIQIHKFELVSPNRKADLVFFLEEVRAGEIVSIDTLFRMNNVYSYSMNGNSYFDYLRTFKLISYQDDNELRLRFQTYSREFSKSVSFYSTRVDQFYNIRYYSDTNILVDGASPLLIFASSWSLNDEKLQRFSGAVHLVKGSPDTESLLKNSPHYFILSYRMN